MVILRQLKRLHWLLAVALVLVLVLAVLTRLLSPTITAPSEFRDANLRVDVLLEDVDGITLKEELFIWKAHLVCPAFDLAPGGDLFLPFWLKHRRGWCGKAALNVPVEIDANGQAILWFRVYPAPHRAGITVKSSPSISAGFSRKGGTAWYHPEIQHADHWLIRPKL